MYIGSFGNLLWGHSPRLPSTLIQTRWPIYFASSLSSRATTTNSKFIFVTNCFHWIVFKGILPSSDSKVPNDKTLIWYPDMTLKSVVDKRKADIIENREFSLICVFKSHCFWKNVHRWQKFYTATGAARYQLWWHHMANQNWMWRQRRCDWIKSSGGGAALKIDWRGGHQWAMGNGQWAMGNGQWAMGNGQWAMGNGQWAMGQ